MISISISDSVTATRRLAYCLWASLLLTACQAGHVNTAHFDDWQSPFYEDHELVGKIWDARKNVWVAEQQLFEELPEYRFILLGEAHDNPDHHQLQARILNRLATTGEKPAVVMEMLAREAWHGQPAYWTDLESLQKQAVLQNARWPWELYTPLLQSVVNHGLELVAGNVKRETLREQVPDLGPGWRKELTARYSVPAQGLRQLEQEIAESHCGYVDSDHIGFMVAAQLQRDRVLTSALASSRTPVVLIAGNGHVRNDYGVPIQLKNTYRHDSLLSVALIPVQPDRLMPDDYLEGVQNAFDILYFTPSHSDEDPCERFKGQLQNLRKGDTE